MAEDYDAAWDEYMVAYSECKPEDFLIEIRKSSTAVSLWRNKQKTTQGINL